MENDMTVVGLCGSFDTQSKTGKLNELIVSEIAHALGVSSSLISLENADPKLFNARTSSDFKRLDYTVQKHIKDADILVVTSPVYNAGIPGLLKHLFDTFEPDSLKGKPIVIAATGGTDRHALVIDYQLRPILNYLKGVVVPSSVFVHSKEFEDEVVLNKSIRQRVKQIINELKGVIPFPERNALH